MSKRRKTQRFIHSNSFASMLTLIIALTSAPALADETAGFTAHVEGELSVEFESDHTFKSDDPDNELSDTYPSVGLAVGWLLTPNFSIQGGFVLEPVLDPAPRADRVFADIGVYVEELYGQYEIGPARLFAGKFNPSFGQAWDLTPGLYGADFAEDYQLTERLGFGAAVSVEGTALGDLTLAGNAFKIDSSGLSRSLFTDRGQASLADGGAGNTSDLANYSVTLDGSNIVFAGGGIAWHLGYSNQQKGETSDDLEGETGLVGGLYGSFKLSESLSLEWLGEAARMENAGGGANDATYLTFGGVLTLDERYNIALAHTARRFDIAGGGGYTDTTTQISVGMEVVDGWTLDVGYKIAKEEGIESPTVGILLGKTFEFGNGD